LQEYEEKLIREALEACRWNQTEAARMLGMPLRTLVHKLTTLGLRRVDEPGERRQGAQVEPGPGERRRRR
jgi:DNA-binding NtrC family response regulator